MTFKKYFETLIDREGITGDLAKRFKKLKLNNFTYEDLYAYLYSRCASEEEIHALKSIYEEYSGELV